MVQTNAHYPTDIGLLFDATRKVIGLISRFCAHHHIPGWRPCAYTIKTVKKRYRITQKLEHSTPKKPEVRKKRAEIIRQAYTSHIEFVRSYLEKTKETIRLIGETIPFAPEISIIVYYIGHAERPMNQTYRRGAPKRVNPTPRT